MKFPALLEVLDLGYDFVMMIDADAMITRYDIELAVGYDILNRENKSFLISSDFNSLNSGVFFVRNTDTAREFLAAGWRVRFLLGHVSAHCSFCLFGV